MLRFTGKEFALTLVIGSSIILCFHYASIMKIFILEDAKRINGMILEFVHIPKTGGSAIEFSAAAQGVNWGACHFFRFSHLNCSNSDWAYPSRILFNQIPVHFDYKDAPWHLPPIIMDPNPYSNRATFTVVRNPVSEKQCSC
jgi:hypothetical protein